MISGNMAPSLIVFLLHVVSIKVLWIIVRNTTSMRLKLQPVFLSSLTPFKLANGIMRPFNQISAFYPQIEFKRLLKTTPLS